MPPRPLEPMPAREPSNTLPEYYRRRAAEYDAIYQKPERQDDLRQLREIVASAFAGCRVLEIACGTGYWTEQLARSASGILATDVSTEVIDFAHTRNFGATPVEFSLADAYNLAALGQTFDGLFAGFWWSHVLRRDLNRFLRGVASVVEPGSSVMFLDNVYVEGSSTPIARVDDDGNQYQSRVLQDGSRHEVLKNFPLETELKSAVAAWDDAPEITFLCYYWIVKYRVGNAVTRQ